MRCDPDKVRSKREALAMTQEKLAAMSNVNARTIQRLESGHSVDKETLADVASALRITPEELLLSEEGQGEAEATTWSATLNRVGSATRLIETLSSVRFAKLELQVEPTAANIETLKTLTRTIERYLPWDRWDTPPDEIPLPPPLSEKLEAMAQINEHLQEIESFGWALFLGQYTELGILPRWHLDEGCWYTRKNQRHELFEVARVVIAPSNRGGKIVVPRDVIWPVEIMTPESIPF